jgi:RNAse (barnase) inhibitor barstar
MNEREGKEENKMNDLKDIAEITQKHFGADLTCTEQYKRIEKKLNELETLQNEKTELEGTIKAYVQKNLDFCHKILELERKLDHLQECEKELKLFKDFVRGLDLYVDIETTDIDDQPFDFEIIRSNNHEIEFGDSGEESLKLFKKIKEILK